MENAGIRPAPHKKWMMEMKICNYPIFENEKHITTGDSISEKQHSTKYEQDGKTH